MTGDRNKDLYKMSKLTERRDKNSEQYQWEKEKKECKFYPSLLKGKVSPDVNTVVEVKGVDNHIQNHYKARTIQATKKVLTQRSGYSPTKGVTRTKQNADNL